jgi:glycosyltransferase involved in cell wall biosynthesis
MNACPDDRELELSILMPCLNEAETLAPCIRKALKSLQDLEIEGEVLIADNGSTDGSQELATRLGARVVAVSEKGYGSALQGGIAVARSRYIIMGDSDDSYDFSALKPFVEKLREGYELVMGCRMPRGGGRIMPGAMPWKHRWIGNPVLSWIGKLFFKCPISDFHCGLRGFSTPAIRSLELRTTGMEFASEMVIKATLRQLSMAEVPITLHKDGRSRPPHLRSWRDGWRHLRFMLLFSPRWLFLIPGIFIFVISAAGTVVLAMKPVEIRGIVLDAGTLSAFGMGLIVGFQLMTFAIFTKVYAIKEGLLPEHRGLERFLTFLNLEKGVLIGMVLMMAGLAILGGALGIWAKADFGDVGYSENLRRVIPAFVLITLGVQVTFASFFGSVLGLKVSSGHAPR